MTVRSQLVSRKQHRYLISPQ